MGLLVGYGCTHAFAVSIYLRTLLYIYYVYICVYTYKYMYICVDICIYTYICVHIYSCILGM